MKTKKLLLSMLSALLILTISSSPVHAQEANEEDITLAPYFFIEHSDTSVDRLPLKATSVTANLNGSIAETYVTQTYKNEGKNALNASYIFPASTKVTVHGMKMTIGNEVVTAKIKEKEEAKQEFEEAKSGGQSASLLEEERPNVFSMDVANIMPGDTISIELHYTELITPSEGTCEFVFPTVVGPRYASPSANIDADMDHWMAVPYIEDADTSYGKYDITVNLATGVPITGLSSKSHDINISMDEKDESTAKVTLSNPRDFAGNRDFILDYELTGQTVNCGLMLNTEKDENFFMLTVQPPQRYEAADIPPREYIFVLDVSGSMSGYPLDTAKELIRNLVGNLTENDCFNIVLFSGDSTCMAPKSIPATEENIKKSIRFIEREEGSGGTEFTPALEKAITIPKNKNYSRSIVTITDGYIYDEIEIFDMISKNLSTTSFFSFGIGSSVNRYLIEGIAKAGMGEAFVVTEAEEAKATAERFRTYIQSPILTDISVTYDGFDVYDVEPPTLSTLFAQKPITLFGKWRGEAAGTIRITGKTGKEDYVQEIDVSQAKLSTSNSSIRYLWARTKVARLTDYGFNENDESAKDEITEIGLKYNMLTPYTSFIAVAETIRNTDSTATDVDQPLPLPQHVSNLSIGGYALGSEPGDMILAALAVCIAGINALFYRRKNRSAKL